MPLSLISFMHKGRQFHRDIHVQSEIVACPDQLASDIGRDNQFCVGHARRDKAGLFESTIRKYIYLRPEK